MSIRKSGFEMMDKATEIYPGITFQRTFPLSRSMIQIPFANNRFHTIELFSSYNHKFHYFLKKCLAFHHHEGNLSLRYHHPIISSIQVLRRLNNIQNE